MSELRVNDAVIMAMEEKRLAAMLSNNPDELAPFLDDDVIYIHSSAVKDSKANYLQSLRDGSLAYRGFRPQYEPIRHLSADVILLSGRIGIDIALHGKPVTLDNLFTAVWRRGVDGAWRLASWQSTPVPARA